MNASVVSGRLRLDWTYSENHHRRETVERLGERFFAALGALVQAAGEADELAYSPSDFPEARMSDRELDRLVRKLCAGRTRDMAVVSEIEDIYELSPLQQGMLYHTLRDAESAVYFEQFAVPLAGALDVGAFERAWQEAARRHAALRTSFHWEELDKPLQVVHRRVELALERHDWRRHSPTERERRFDEFLRADRARGFELDQAPRDAARADPHGRDEPSVRLELSPRTPRRLEHAAHQPGGLRPVRGPVQRTDSRASAKPAVSRLHRLAPDERPRSCRDVLARPPPRLLLTDAAGGAAPPCASGRDIRAVRGAPALLSRTRSLPRWSASSGATAITLNTLVQGGWAVLLSRYGDVDDVALGVVVSGRPAELEGVESMVGLFINTLPLRVHVLRTSRSLRGSRGSRPRTQKRDHEHSL